MSASETYLQSPMRAFSLESLPQKKKKGPSLLVASDELMREEVPIRVVSDRREDRLAQLLVRIAFEVVDGADSRKGEMEALSIRVTDESDSFFLYRLDLTEEDFKVRLVCSFFFYSLPVAEFDSCPVRD